MVTGGFCRPHVVTAEWIIESIKLHYPAPEDQYSCVEAHPATTEPPSPSLKKVTYISLIYLYVRYVCKELKNLKLGPIICLGCSIQFLRLCLK